ncbi:uncharacterized protein LOC118465833 [Anopheles albimanus]|uniref:Uncharacterized protein n=1 Tax=Anopheles albimanus TaxID=7167 RepID=A0A182FBB1_ANOAL|nr:uncharacterized protein LOC118465833 [Anopheles albimanus]
MVRSASKAKIRLQVPRKKLQRALELLEQPLKNAGDRDDQGCPFTMLKHRDTSTTTLRPLHARRNWLEHFSSTVTRHNWDTFIRSLKLASQNNSFCGVQAILRNTIFGMLSHPLYREPATIKSILSAITPCSSGADVKLCIETMAQAINGHTLAWKPKSNRKTPDAEEASPIEINLDVDCKRETGEAI